MKRFVNGVEAELPDSPDVEIASADGRILVRTRSGTQSAVCVRTGDAVLISYRGVQYRIERTRATAAGRSSALDSGEIFAPMPGQVVDVLVEAGQRVEHRQKLLVLEAMKTQQAFVAPFPGTVATVCVHKGQQVQEGDKLVAIAPAEVTS